MTIAYTAVIATSNHRSTLVPIFVAKQRGDRHHLRSDERASEVARKIARRLDGRAMTIARSGARPVKVDA